MIETASIVLPLFGLIALGYAVAGSVRTRPQGINWLNRFVFYFALPAFFFEMVAGAAMTAIPGSGFLLVAIFGTYSTFAIAFSIAALANRGHIPVATVQGSVASCSNGAYLGPAVTVAALGPAAALPTALIIGFESVMFLLMVPLMMALGGAERGNLGAVLLEAARSIVFHPLIVAIAAGFAFAASGLPMPEPVDAFLGLLGGAAIPAALFALGVGLAQRRPARAGIELPLLVAIKLLVHPLVVYLLLGWIGRFDPVWIYTAVLMAALPPAPQVFVLARRYRTYAGQASAAILIGTALSALTVTGLVALIASGALPVDPFH